MSAFFPNKRVAISGLSSVWMARWKAKPQPHCELNSMSILICASLEVRGRQAHYIYNVAAESKIGSHKKMGGRKNGITADWFCCPTVGAKIDEGASLGRTTTTKTTNFSEIPNPNGLVSTLEILIRPNCKFHSPRLFLFDINHVNNANLRQLFVAPRFFSLCLVQMFNEKMGEPEKKAAPFRFRPNSMSK